MICQRFSFDATVAGSQPVRVGSGPRERWVCEGSAGQTGSSTKNTLKYKLLQKVPGIQGEKRNISTGKMNIGQALKFLSCDRV